MAVSKMTHTLHDQLLKPEYKKKKTYHVEIQFDPSCSGFVSRHTYKNLSAAVQAAKRRQQKFGVN